MESIIDLLVANSSLIGTSRNVKDLKTISQTTMSSPIIMEIENGNFSKFWNSFVGVAYKCTLLLLASIQVNWCQNLKFSIPKIQMKSQNAKAGKFFAASMLLGNVVLLIDLIDLNGHHYSPPLLC